jgi:hypothetical protein
VKLCESFVELCEIAIPLRHGGKHKEKKQQKTQRKIISPPRQKTQRKFKRKM